MRFSKLSIENFRSIKNVVEINFPPNSNLCAIVGSNNAGKSNILSALAMVLGVQFPPLGKRDLEATDFYNYDTTETVVVSLHLATPITDKNVYNKEFLVEGFRLEAKHYKRGTQKGELHTELYCFGRNAKGEEDATLKDADSIRGAPRPIHPREYISQVGTVYALEPSTLAGFFRTTGRGPLAQLLDLYREDFPKATNLYPREAQSGALQKTAQDAFDQVASQLTPILRTKRLEEIESALGRHVAEFLGLPSAARFRIDFGIPEAQELLEELVDLRIREDPSLRAVSLGRIGTGYLSLFRVAVLQALLEVEDRGSAILMIEEPESYLHPHLRRFFYEILGKLGDRGDQIFYATHAQEFVDLRSFREVVRVAKPTMLRTEVFQVPKGASIGFDSMHIKLRGKGNQELYFAERVLLTEGQDDRMVFELLLEKKGFPVDARSISVIDCGSKDNIPDYIELCKSLGIGYFTIFDSDPKNPQSKVTTAKIEKAAGSDASKCHPLPGTLESALNTTKQDENWRHLLAIVEPLTYAQIGSSYPEACAAIEAFSSGL